MNVKQAKAIYKGTTEIKKVYAGSNLIYEKSSGPTLTELECYLKSGRVVKEDYGNSITYVYEGDFNKTYKVTKILSSRFRCAIDNQVSDVSRGVRNYIDNSAGTEITISTDATSKYVYIFGWSNNDTEITADQIKSSITVEEVS